MLPANQAVSWTKKHSCLAKWNILFEKTNEWILFKPNPGVKFYSCYSCKNLFLSKIAFQDHINRRVITIKYKCKDCSNLLTFFNRCSFLLHTRKHYNINEGELNLSHLDIFILSDDLIGFHYHENIPYLYSDDEEYVTDDRIINTNFYMPDDNDMGKQIIHMKAHKLVFHNDAKSLTLKQIASNIPLCEIIIHSTITTTTTSNTPTSTIVKSQITRRKRRSNQRKLIEIDDNSSCIDTNLITTTIKEEPNPNDSIMSKIESLSEIALVKKSPTCTECLQTINKSMTIHFSYNNKPYDDSLYCIICKYIAPTKCSLSAHKRIHSNLPPFVCPECGKNFPNSTLLTVHIEDVCYHTAKRIRYRCPAMKCGKIFVVRNTFATHFANHLQCIQHCSTCNVAFLKDTDFEEHKKTHNSDTCQPIKSYNCLVCKNHEIITNETFNEHINYHIFDKERCIYIYRCKICHSYFRSVATYGVHRQRCGKTEKLQTNSSISTNCTYCSFRIIFRDREKDKSCIICKQVNYNPEIVQKKSDENQLSCVLCKENLGDDHEQHDEICKYKNPIVPVQNVETKLSESDSDICLENNEINSDRNQQEDDLITVHKRKRRKRSNNSNKSSSSSTNQKNDDCELNLDDTINDDNDYHCKLCNFKHDDRKEFHSHILKHRDVSTAYQCMECGECFVVKPSLLKHLVLYHKITNTDQYLLNNNCYDKDAIEQLETNLKLMPGEHKGPIKQNQCSVCLMQCESVIALNKHFRIHGRAFLLKKGH